MARLAARLQEYQYSVGHIHTVGEQSVRNKDNEGAVAVKSDIIYVTEGAISKEEWNTETSEDECCAQL